MEPVETILKPAEKIPVAPIQHAEQKKQQGTIDPLLLAYMEIFECVQTEHDTTSIQAKGLAANVSAQNALIAEEAEINFANIRHSQLFTHKRQAVEHSSFIPGAHGGAWDEWTTYKMVTVPKKVGQSVLDHLQMHNQQISAVRSLLENQITVLRQSSQISQTDLNSSVDENQQSTQQGTSLLQMLIQLTNLVSRI